jgi:carbamoylphosphate synthase large subunit
MKINGGITDQSSWYEVRVDYEKVAAFAPAQKHFARGEVGLKRALEESLKQAHRVVEITQLDLYRNKVMQIVFCKEDDEKVIYETHPTVFEG